MTNLHHKKQSRMITFWDGDTGKIKYSVTVREGEEDAACQGNDCWVEGIVDASSHTIDPMDGVVVPHSDCPVTVEGHKLVGIPSDAEVIVRMLDAASHTDGEVILEAEEGVPEKVMVHVHHYSFGLREFEVECGETVEKGPDKGNRFRVSQDVLKLRRHGYDSAGDQLDAIWKGLEAQASGKELPSETLEAMDRWRKNKGKFPLTKEKKLQQKDK